MPSRQPLTLTRRSLLALGGAAATCLPFAGRAFGAVGRPEGNGPLRVGFATGSGALPALATLYRDRVAQAGRGPEYRLVAADRAACGARPERWSLAFHGLCAAPGGAILDSLSVDVVYRVAGRELPACAWSGRVDDTRPMHPVRFTVGAEALAGLDFSARRPGRGGLRAALRGEGPVQHCRRGGGPGELRPATGLYVVAGPDRGGRPADWRGLRLTADGARSGVAGWVLADAAGRPVERDWLIFTLTPA